jgi:hypothetical protein
VRIDLTERGYKDSPIPRAYEWTLKEQEQDPMFGEMIAISRGKGRE